MKEMERNEPRLMLRAEEVAERLAISRAKCYGLIASGELPSVQLGRRCLRVPLDALRQWIARRSTGDAEQD